MVNSMEPTSNGSGSIACRESSEIGEAMKSRELAGRLPNGTFIYRKDVVTSRKHESLLGAVMEVAGDTDSDDGDRNGGGGDYDSLPDGQVRVIWTDGSDTTENISDVTVVDRGFSHGDTVASASDPTGQLGRVVDVDITVDLLAANGEVMKHVSSKDLKRVRAPLVGDYVVLGHWLGRVDDVLDNVTVLFDDGSLCKVVKADPLRLKPLSRPVADNASSSYYPGLRVKGATSSVFKSSRWLSGLWKANHLEGTVIKVQAVSVVVYWIASSCFNIRATSAIYPAEEQDPKNLTLLSCFQYANWQLGDWCHLLSPPLPSPSLAGETSKTSEVPIRGLKSSTNYYEECLPGEYTGQALLGGHRVSEKPNPEAAAQDEAIKSIHMVMPDELDLSFLYGNQRDGCNESCSPHNNLEGNYQCQRCDSMALQKTPGACDINGTESNHVLSECGSCSSSSPVSIESAHENWPAYRKRLCKVFFKRDKKARRGDETFERALFIVNTLTKVDVAWQCGTRECGIDSRSLIPIRNPSDHEFFPEQYVLEKTSSGGDDWDETYRSGIVRSVDSKERTVCVKWFKPVSRPAESREFDCDEVVSAYELDGDANFDYRYGDIVVIRRIRLSSVSVSDETADYGSRGQLEQHAELMEAEDYENMKHSDYDEAEHSETAEAGTNFTCLSWLGHITGLQDGDVEVTWADGFVSKVGPQAIFVVGRKDDSFDGESDIIDDTASWETIDENIVGREKQTAIPPEDHNVGTNGPLSAPRVALGFVSRLATGLFPRGGTHIGQPDADHIAVGETEPMEIIEVSDTEIGNGELSSEESDPLDDLSAPDERHSREAATEDAEMMIGDNLGSPMSVETNAGGTGADVKDDPSFKHLDISENPCDHYFLGTGEQNAGGRKWVKKVHQEWSILEKNLPDAIYVRVFEDRMDLLRAVIVGACGTPYQDGLFFFDVRFPSEYPQVPPVLEVAAPLSFVNRLMNITCDIQLLTSSDRMSLVTFTRASDIYSELQTAQPFTLDRGARSNTCWSESVNYHSGCMRINPNLYANGKVCLSLLNTWGGKENEVWNPSSSSILQVLVSIQGLVLNSKPYFNEAGYEKQVGTVEGEKNSLQYNENTHLLNLKSMLYLLQRSPMHFEEFVKDHFRRRGHYILKACEAYYMEGCMIGSLTKDACLTEKSSEHPCSNGFKLILAKILPKLISVLSEAGADCHRFEYLLKSESFPRN